MSLHYLLVVVVVSDVKVMSSTVAVLLLAYMRFFESNRTKIRVFFQYTEPKRNRNKKIYSAHP